MSAAKWGHSRPQEFDAGSALACPWSVSLLLRIQDIGYSRTGPGVRQSPRDIASTARLQPAAPSRLFEDAQTTSGWRVLGFSPVVPDQPNASESDRRAGVLASVDPRLDGCPYRSSINFT